MRIESKVYTDEEYGSDVWFWEVWDADEPINADGTEVFHIFYGRGVEGTREAAEAKVAERVAQVPQIKAAYDRVR